MSLQSADKEKLHQQYLDLIRFYQEPVKSVVLAAERVDKQQRIPGSSIIEIRSAFEHVARAHAVVFGFGDAEAEDSGLSHYEYCSKNLNKAHGHLYRAAYDAYDSIAIALTESIRSNLDVISKAALFSVIPDAAVKIIVPYEAANQLITEEKKRKDVVGKEQEEKVYVQYEKAIQELMNVKRYIDGMMGTLVAFEEELKEKEQLILATEREHREEVLKNDGKKINWAIVTAIFAILAFILAAGDIMHRMSTEAATSTTTKEVPKETPPK